TTKNSNFVLSYQCPDCLKVYKKLCNLKQHLRNEYSQPPQFQCPYCPQRTTQQSSLRQHIIQRHDGFQQNFVHDTHSMSSSLTCKVMVGFSAYVETNTLFFTLTVGSFVVLYPHAYVPGCLFGFFSKCRIILFVFYAVEVFKVYGGLPYPIGHPVIICFVLTQNNSSEWTSFADSYPLEDTEQFIQHSAEKPLNQDEFQCPACDKIYKYKSNMIRHFRHECESASWSFLTNSESGDILQQLLQNSDNQSNHQEVFHCPSCRKMYKYKSNMIRHFRHECGKEPQFQCPYCPYRLTQKGNLLTHIKRKHSDTQANIQASPEFFNV
ncbi:zinc finger protein 64-like, partial [Schistocerca cancellata]|uniref:zinc finger protein 64-like n=1 Tax=Schistocerca cancellata TaxID=274614 RepID=UPI00211845B7